MAGQRYCMALLLVLLTVACAPHLTQSQTFWKNPPVWQPKTDSTLYIAKNRDWAGVISACRAVGAYEKRFMNFFTRAAFHDSLAVNVTACSISLAACGGADSSNLLSVDEMTRTENAYDNFTFIASRAAIKIASFYDTSVADALAVCGAVAAEYLSNDRIKIIGYQGLSNFPVGRLDTMMPAAPAQLPAADTNISTFKTWWNQRNFTVEEGVALLGSHSLIDEQACLVDTNPLTYCDLSKSTCQNLRMFNWQNHYYQDVCTPTITVVKHQGTNAVLDDPVFGMDNATFDSLLRSETCKFSSPEFRAHAKNHMNLIRAGFVRDPDVVEDFSVFHTNTDCKAGAAWGASQSCPHAHEWFYTVNDALLGKTCQGKINMATSGATEVQTAMRKFLNQATWDGVYRDAYIKMVSIYATYAAPTIWDFVKQYFGDYFKVWNGTNINGGECPSGFVWDTSLGATCATVGSCFPPPPPSGKNSQLYCTGCSPCCRCKTAFKNGVALTVDVTMPPFPPISPSPPPTPPAPAAPPPPPLDAFGNIAINPSGTTMTNPPTSPYIDTAKICPTANGQSIFVKGFPASPFRWVPFSSIFRNPVEAQPTLSTCVPTTASFNGSFTNSNAGCIDAYVITVKEVALNLTCPGPLTNLLSYNGSVPGPTFRVQKGRQTLVRFTSTLTNPTFLDPEPPCTTATGRQGRPISVHLHGSASLAPYDGWAEDETCGGETKDYIYPNNRATTLWYHDHGLDITAQNAYYGLAGFYHVTDKVQNGGCGEPWNLDNIPEYQMILTDRVFDSGCQFRMDIETVHENNLYGDVNLVNGIPWPAMSVDPGWARFRLLNSAISRPWLLHVVDDVGTKVSATVCQIVAGDGGFRRSPTAFPARGLFMGVAERYEVVCDFSTLGGKTLYIWNEKDDRRMKGVPFFCYSHLIARITVRGTCANTTACAVKLQPTVPATVITAVDKVLDTAIISAATTRANNGDCDRYMKFGRRNGEWRINGESWHTFRIAAADVGQNTHELWCLETGGGWFHPIHIHLVDFYVLARLGGQSPGVEPYEQFTPKDVVQLHPGAKVAILARWGAHRGEYMFHCHNLRHEDRAMMRSFNVTSSSLGLKAGQQGLIVNGGVLYDTYHDPMLDSAAAKPTSTVPAITTTYLQEILARRIHKIFYPTDADAAGDTGGLDGVNNPWRVTCAAQ